MRTLRDYKNYIRPTRGFNPEVLNKLAKKTISFSEIERYVNIFFGEIKIQENVGELVEFVDLDDFNINYTTLENVQKLASHVFSTFNQKCCEPMFLQFCNFCH